ncbi:MAG: hypothetical protein SX243_00655 [Acidobacteriota bacterium]|nr:hypothetical protein [Acidobacteriota bacterium]
MSNEPRKREPAKRGNQPRKRWTAHFGRAFTWVSNLTVAFTALGTLASFKTWDHFAEWLAELSQRLGEIIELFGRVIHALLVPWVFLRNLIFRFVPLDIPDHWEDPVLLGLFIIWFPLNLAFLFWAGFSKQISATGADHLEQAVIASAMEPGRTAQANRIHKLVEQLGLQAIAQGPIADLLRALRADEFPEDLLMERANRALADVVAWRRQVEENWVDTRKSWKAESRGLLMRAFLAVVLLLALSLDQVLNGGGFVAFSILWRSAVVFVLFGVGAAVFGLLLLPLLVIILQPLSKLIARLPGVESWAQERFLPWYLRQMRGLVTDPEPDEETTSQQPSNANNEVPAVPEEPLFTAGTCRLAGAGGDGVAYLRYSQDILGLARIQHVEHEMDSGKFFAVHDDGNRQLLARWNIHPDRRSELHQMNEIQLQLVLEERVLDSSRVPLRHFWMG